LTALPDGVDDDDEAAGAFGAGLGVSLAAAGLGLGAAGLSFFNGSLATGALGSAGLLVSLGLALMGLVIVLAGLTGVASVVEGAIFLTSLTLVLSSSAGCPRTLEAERFSRDWL